MFNNDNNFSSNHDIWRQADPHVGEAIVSAGDRLIDLHMAGSNTYWLTGPTKKREEVA